MTGDKKVDMTLMDHLMELLNRLRMVVLSVIVSTIIVMLLPISIDFSSFSAENPFYTTITSLVIRNLQERFLPAEAELLPLSFIAPLEVYVFVSLILGVLISLPVISYELYKFINPALHIRERKAAFQFVAAFAGLFLFGFTLGYLFIVPMTMRVMLLFSKLLNLPPKYDFAEFFSTIGFSLLICGLIFTFPTYIVLLVKAGILKTKSITSNRKYLYGGFIVLIAIIDPEPSLITESIIFLPILILTEISILIAKRIERTREATSNSIDDSSKRAG
jgi:sec-independent protein translocase protein TatC